MKSVQLREKRARLVQDARAIYDKAETEKRDLDAQEREQYDKTMADVDQLKKDVESMERLETAENDLGTSRPVVGLQRSDGVQPAAQRPQSRIVELRKNVLGENRRVELPDAEAADKEMRGFRRAIVAATDPIEFRALQKDLDVYGGYLSAPQQFQAELIQALDNAVFVRQICRVLPPLTSAESLGAPSLDNDPADPTWTAELAIGTEDTTMSFGKRELAPHPLAKWIKVSKTLLRRSTMSADAIVRQRLAYKFGVVQENNFLNGTGALSPLGVFTASSNGISTGRDVSTGNTTTDVRFDGLMEALYSLKGQYRNRLTGWIWSRGGVKRIRKLKDGDGNYIWQASVQAGEPDRLLNYPVYESEYAPDTWSGSAYVGIIGDFSYYWIVDALTLTIQVLVELDAGTNQNRYLGRLEADGMPVLEEAFARVQLV